MGTHTRSLPDCQRYSHTINVLATSLSLKVETVREHLRLTGGAAAGIVLSLDAPSPQTGTGTALVADGEDVVTMGAGDNGFMFGRRWEHGVAGTIIERFSVVVRSVAGHGARRARGPCGQPGRPAGGHHRTSIPCGDLV